MVSVMTSNSRVIRKRVDAVRLVQTTARSPQSCGELAATLSYLKPTCGSTNRLCIRRFQVENGGSQVVRVEHFHVNDGKAVIGNMQFSTRDPPPG